MVNRAQQTFKQKQTKQTQFYMNLDEENNEEVVQEPSSNDLFEEMLRKAMEEENEKLQKQGKSLPHQMIGPEERIFPQHETKSKVVQKKTIPSRNSKFNRIRSVENEDKRNNDNDHMDIEELSKPIPQTRDEIPLSKSAALEQGEYGETGPSSNDLFEQQLAKALSFGVGSAVIDPVGTDNTSTGDLTAKLTSKAWKERSDAYEELTKIFSAAGENDPCFYEYRTFFYFIWQSNLFKSRSFHR